MALQNIPPEFRVDFDELGTYGQDEEYRARIAQLMVDPLLKSRTIQALREAGVTGSPSLSQLYEAMAVVGVRGSVPGGTQSAAGQDWLNRFTSTSPVSPHEEAVQASGRDFLTLQEALPFTRAGSTRELRHWIKQGDIPGAYRDPGRPGKPWVVPAAGLRHFDPAGQQVNPAWKQFYSIGVPFGLKTTEAAEYLSPAMESGEVKTQQQAIDYMLSNLAPAWRPLVQKFGGVSEGGSILSPGNENLPVTLRQMIQMTPHQQTRMLGRFTGREGQFGAGYPYVQRGEDSEPWHIRAITRAGFWAQTPGGTFTTRPGKLTSYPSRKELQRLGAHTPLLAQGGGLRMGMADLLEGPDSPQRARMTFGRAAVLIGGGDPFAGTGLMYAPGAQAFERRYKPVVSSDFPNIPSLEEAEKLVGTSWAPGERPSFFPGHQLEPYPNWRATVADVVKTKQGLGYVLELTAPLEDAGPAAKMGGSKVLLQHYPLLEQAVQFLPGGGTRPLDAQFMWASKDLQGDVFQFMTGAGLQEMSRILGVPAEELQQKAYSELGTLPIERFLQEVSPGGEWQGMLQDVGVPMRVHESALFDPSGEIAERFALQGVTKQNVMPLQGTVIPGTEPRGPTGGRGQLVSPEGPERIESPLYQVMLKRAALVGPIATVLSQEAPARTQTLSRAELERVTRGDTGFRQSLEREGRWYGRAFQSMMEAAAATRGFGTFGNYLEAGDIEPTEIMDLINEATVAARQEEGIAADQMPAQSRVDRLLIEQMAAHPRLGSMPIRWGLDKEEAVWTPAAREMEVFITEGQKEGLNINPVMRGVAGALRELASGGRSAMPDPQKTAEVQLMENIIRARGGDPDAPGIPTHRPAGERRAVAELTKMRREAAEVQPASKGMRKALDYLGGGILELGESAKAAKRALQLKLPKHRMAGHRAHMAEWLAPNEVVFTQLHEQLEKSRRHLLGEGPIPTGGVHPVVVSRQPMGGGVERLTPRLLSQEEAEQRAREAGVELMSNAAYVSPVLMQAMGGDFDADLIYAWMRGLVEIGPDGELKVAPEQMDISSVEDVGAWAQRERELGSAPILWESETGRWMPSIQALDVMKKTFAEGKSISDRELWEATEYGRDVQGRIGRQYSFLRRMEWFADRSGLAAPGVREQVSEFAKTVFQVSHGVGQRPEPLPPGLQMLHDVQGTSLQTGFGFKYGREQRLLKEKLGIDIETPFKLLDPKMTGPFYTQRTEFKGWQGGADILTRAFLGEHPGAPLPEMGGLATTPEERAATFATGAAQALGGVAPEQFEAHRAEIEQEALAYVGGTGSLGRMVETVGRKGILRSTLGAAVTSSQASAVMRQMRGRPVSEIQDAIASRLGLEAGSEEARWAHGLGVMGLQVGHAFTNKIIPPGRARREQGAMGVEALAAFQALGLTPNYYGFTAKGVPAGSAEVPSLEEVEEARAQLRSSPGLIAGAEGAAPQQSDVEYLETQAALAVAEAAAAGGPEGLSIRGATAVPGRRSGERLPIRRSPGGGPGSGPPAPPSDDWPTPPDDSTGFGPGDTAVTLEMMEKLQTGIAGQLAKAMRTPFPKDKLTDDMEHEIRQTTVQLRDWRNNLRGLVMAGDELQEEMVPGQQADVAKRMGAALKKGLKFEGLGREGAPAETVQAVEELSTVLRDKGPQGTTVVDELSKFQRMVGDQEYQAWLQQTMEPEVPGRFARAGAIGARAAQKFFGGFGFFYLTRAGRYATQAMKTGLEQYTTDEAAQEQMMASAGLTRGIGGVPAELMATQAQRLRVANAMGLATYRTYGGLLNMVLAEPSLASFGATVAMPSLFGGVAVAFGASAFGATMATAGVIGGAAVPALALGLGAAWAAGGRGYLPQAQAVLAESRGQPDWQAQVGAWWTRTIAPVAEGLAQPGVSAFLESVATRGASALTSQIRGEVPGRRGKEWAESQLATLSEEEQGRIAGTRADRVARAGLVGLSALNEDERRLALGQFLEFKPEWMPIDVARQALSLALPHVKEGGGVDWQELTPLATAMMSGIEVGRLGSAMLAARGETVPRSQEEMYRYLELATRVEPWRAPALIQRMEQMATVGETLEHLGLGWYELAPTALERREGYGTGYTTFQLGEWDIAAMPQGALGRILETAGMQQTRWGLGLPGRGMDVLAAGHMDPEQYAQWSAREQFELGRVRTMFESFTGIGMSYGAAAGRAAGYEGAPWGVQMERLDKNQLIRQRQEQMIAGGSSWIQAETAGLALQAYPREALMADVQQGAMVDQIRDIMMGRGMTWADANVAMGPGMAPGGGANLQETALMLGREQMAQGMTSTFMGLGLEKPTADRLQGLMAGQDAYSQLQWRRVAGQDLRTWSQIAAARQASGRPLTTMMGGQREALTPVFTEEGYNIYDLQRQAFQAEGIQLSYAGTMGGLGIQQRGLNWSRVMTLGGTFEGFNVPVGTQELQWQARQRSYQAQMVQMGIQREQMELGHRQFMEQWQFQGAQREVQFGWQRQDLAYNRDMSALQFGWRMEDFQENIRRATGRERYQLTRQQQRETITYDMQQGRFDVDEQRIDQQKEWADELHEMQRRHYEERLELQRRQHDASMANMAEQQAIAEELHRIEVKNTEIQFQQQQAQISHSAGMAEKQKDLAERQLAMAKEEMKSMARWENLFREEMPLLMNKFMTDFSGDWYGFLAWMERQLENMKNEGGIEGPPDPVSTPSRRPRERPNRPDPDPMMQHGATFIGSEQRVIVHPGEAILRAEQVLATAMSGDRSLLELQQLVVLMQVLVELVRMQGGIRIQVNADNVGNGVDGGLSLYERAQAYYRRG